MNTDNNISALDVYLDKAYKFVMLAPTSVAMFSAIWYTIYYFIGWYSDISGVLLFIFDLTNIFYMNLALYFYKTGLKGDEIVRKKKLKNHKIAVGLIILIQFNFIAYLIPYGEWFAFAPFFIFFTIFFFDIKLTSIVSLGILISTYITWFTRKDLMWVVRDKHTIPNIAIRVSYLNIFVILILAMVYYGKKYLIEELERYANYDTLTHLLNRRSMDNYLNEAYRQVKTGKTSFCMLLIDIDNFKHVNDTYGHDCGDEVLINTSRIIQNTVRNQDVVFRWGGEEILVLLNANKDESVVIAEDIRKTIEANEINYRNQVKFHVTVTIGVASYHTKYTIQDVMDDVDAKLYYGKNHGKDQVVSTIPSE